MKLSLLTDDLSARHPHSPLIWINPGETPEDYPAPAGFAAHAYSESHDRLPVATIADTTVPQMVDRSQLFLALYAATGLTRAQLRAGITDEAALIEFDERRYIARSHPLVASLAAALGLSSAQVDAIFIAAEKL